MAEKWTAADIPDQAGRTAVVTGANSGLGLGALPELYTATRPNLDGGLFIGPDGFEEQRGHPKVVSPVKAGGAALGRLRA